MYRKVIVILLLALTVMIANIFLPQLEDSSNRMIPHLLAILLLLSIVCFFLTHIFCNVKIYCKSTLSKGLISWIALQTAYVLYALIITGSFKSLFLDYFKFVMWALIGIVFYSFGYSDRCKYEINGIDRRVILIRKIGVAMTLMVFFRSLFLLFYYKGLRPDFISQELLNSNTYLLLWGSIFVLMVKNHNIRYLLFIFSILMVIAIGKRGPVVAIIIGLLMYTFHKRRNIFIWIRSKNLIFISFFAIVIIPILFIFAPNIFDTFLDRWSMTSKYHDTMGTLTSSRSEIWISLIDRYFNSHALYKLFGFGFYSAPEYIQKMFGVNIYAHSDFVEILYDNGLFGIVLFIFLHYGMIKEVIYSKRNNSKYSYILFVLYVTYLSTNLFTQSTIGLKNIWFWIGFGFISGLSSKESASNGSSNEVQLSLNNMKFLPTRKF